MTSRNSWAVLAACTLSFGALTLAAGPALAKSAWVCKVDGKKTKVKGKNSKAKQKDCEAKGGTWEENQPKVESVEPESPPADSGGGGGGW